MREVIQIGVGSGGIQIIQPLISTLATERGLEVDGSFSDATNLQMDGIEVNFQRSAYDKFQARSLLIDPFRSSIDTYLSAGQGDLPFVTLGSAPRRMNCWAYGCYEYGPLMREPVLEAIRKIAENCSSLDSLTFIHTLGGGTGSGLTSFLLPEVAEQFPTQQITPVSILPSTLVSDIVVEPYNAVLTLDYLGRYSTAAIVIDNESLMRLSTTRYKNPTPTYQDLNHFIAGTYANITGAYTFRSELNWTYRKIVENLTPFPRLKYLELGLAPWTCRCGSNKNLTIPEMTTEVITRKYGLSALDNQIGKYLGAFLLFRGDVKALELTDPPLDTYHRDHTFPYLPDSLRIGKLDVRPRGLRCSIGLMDNHTSIKDSFRRIYDMEQVLRSRNAFLHWYTEEGMGEAELTCAEESLSTLISEYTALV